MYFFTGGIRSVDAEFVAFDVQHGNAGVGAVVERLYMDGAEPEQSGTFGLEYGEAFGAGESGADSHVEVYAVLDGFPLGDALEVQARANARGIHAGGPRVILGGKRVRGDHVPEHLASEASEPLGFGTVEGDLKLLDPGHRSTVST
jgi:hypothetical protein